jgi:hypothetical protein
MTVREDFEKWVATKYTSSALTIVLKRNAKTDSYYAPIIEFAWLAYNEALENHG